MYSHYSHYSNSVSFKATHNKSNPQRAYTDNLLIDTYPLDRNHTIAVIFGLKDVMNVWAQGNEVHLNNTYLISKAPRNK